MPRGSSDETVFIAANPRRAATQNETGGFDDAEARGLSGLRRAARHDVGAHDAGVKRLHHPIVGRLELTYEGMTFAADPDLVLFAFTAEVGSKSEEALNLLASWAATPGPQVTGELHDRR